MPQLDFFTFPHQYLVACLCFCGMYYFNLFFLFSWIKYFYLNKIFSINALAANTLVVRGDFHSIIVSLLEQEQEIYFPLNKWIKKCFKFFFKKQVAALNFTLKNNSIDSYMKLNLFIFGGFLCIFFFLKNILIFNAEKLMLIYFLIISLFLFLLIRNYLIKFLIEDLKNFLLIVSEIEIAGEKSLESLKFFLKKFSLEITTTLVEIFLLKTLETKTLLYRW